MRYSPDVKSLAYSELNFVSTKAGMSKVNVAYDLDALYDEVSAEVSVLFVSDSTGQLSLPVAREAQTV